MVVLPASLLVLYAFALAFAFCLWCSCVARRRAPEYIRRRMNRNQRFASRAICVLLGASELVRLVYFLCTNSSIRASTRGVLCCVRKIGRVTVHRSAGAFRPGAVIHRMFAGPAAGPPGAPEPALLCGRWAPQSASGSSLVRSEKRQPCTSGRLSCLSSPK
jgi:hypothetical protein